MQNFKTKTTKTKNRVMRRVGVFALLAALLLQSFALSISALFTNVGSILGDNDSGTNSNSNAIVNGFGGIDTDEIISSLRKDFLGTINENLLMRIDEYELSGPVDVIITFTENSLIERYNQSVDKDAMTYAEFSATKEAKEWASAVSANQDVILEALQAEGLITDVKHKYNTLLDGAFVHTTYEQIKALSKADGVGRVTVSNSYEPAAAVENPVNVYSTGIFNSSDISFTGKGTIVSILDTGCDYSHSAFTTHQVVDPLWNRDEIAEKLPELMAYGYHTDDTLEAREVYYGNITLGKIAYGYDYADKDPDVMPFNNVHGTHVAGIIGGYDDEIVGVAIDTQFAIMKVFSDKDGGADDGDIIAALEDSVKLGVDAINMSLGASGGFSLESDADKIYKNELYQRIHDAGISLIVAAANDHSSAYGGEQGNTNKTDNPDTGIVGAPATYAPAFTVASINGNKENYMFVNGSTEVFFKEAYNNNSKEYDFFEMLGVTKENPRMELEYVTVPGLGYAVNYSGLELQGKIALVRRGDITFQEKIQYAYEAGAIAVIVYNNVFGEIGMTIGNDPKIPAISIGKDEGEAMAALSSGKVVFDFTNEAGPFMSDFSSWGPTSDLKLKPEITAHGGNIYSAVPGGGYEELSGTSMAAPNMCGIAVLIRQFVKEKYPEFSATEVRDLVEQLCMSTATIANNMKGNPYSPRKQGAGIADIVKATTTPAYLYLNADGTGKPKLELGDDPLRTGVYTMTLYLKNLSNEAVSYTLGNLTMTESVSTSDPEFVAEMAYMLSNSAEYSASGEGVSLENGVLTVAGGKVATVTAKIILSDADKAYLDSTFANGMYVEGFFTFDNVAENGVDLNAPFLAFYGNWGDAPIFDLDFYEEETEAHNNAIDEEDKIKADYFPTMPVGSYYYDYVIPLGSFLYKIDESKYTPIPGNRKYAAVSYFNETINGIFGVYAGLLRGAKELNIVITDTTTGEVVWSQTQYNCYKAHYEGTAYPYIAKFEDENEEILKMYNYTTGEYFGANNTKFEVTMTAKLDWDSGTRNAMDTYSFSFTVDYEAPTVVDATFRTEYDKTKKENRYYADIMVYDNHYAMSIRPVIIYEYTDVKGKVVKTYASLEEFAIPVYQENIGEVTKVTLEITDYIDLIAESAQPDGLTIYIDDYALNAGVSFIPFPETDSTDLEFEFTELELPIHDTVDLTKHLFRKDTAENVADFQSDYLRTLTWASSDESVVAIKGGQIETLKPGTATISVTGSKWGTVNNETLYKTMTITVTEEEKDNSNSSLKVPIKSLDFVSYDTLFAFSNDINSSEIGETGSFGYFDGNCSISFYPSERVKLNYNLKPWNLSLNDERYSFEWKSSNPRVATVDEEGVVTAVSEGSARISLQITIDGKTSLLAARCSVEVKSEFVVENRKLVAYKGHGGDVVIPDDEGIYEIAAYAFSHFYLDNTKPGKNEDGEYDLDMKKDPLGNDTITSVVIPDGVTTIAKYAFYNCSALTNVVLPETCEIISNYAFAKCNVLENINLDDVKIISDYAFQDNDSLTCDELGGINLSGVYAIGKEAFAGSRLSEVKLDNLSRVSDSAFANCEYLVSVELGPKTRIATNMFKNSAVKEIVIYSDIISDSAFEGCKDLQKVTIKNDITYLGANAFKGCKKLTEVIFEKGCEEIAAEAFYQCEKLTNITLPDGEIVIGDGAFARSGLSKLVLGKNTVFKSMGVATFEKVEKLTVDVSASNYYKVEGNAVYNKSGDTLVLYLPGSGEKTFTVPANVKHIGAGAFASDSSLTTIDFASGSLLESIGYAAFANCVNLATVNLPTNTTISIGDAAFKGATYLKNINLSNVKSVGKEAFVKTIIESVNMTLAGVEIGEKAFANLNSLKTVVLGEGATIGDSAFFKNTKVVSVTFGGGNVTVGASAFEGCTALATFDFVDVSGVIGERAFYGCTKLAEVNIPNVTEIGAYAFHSCSLVSSVTTGSLKVIGAEAFRDCKLLASIDLCGVTSLGQLAFYQCSSLKKVTLDESITKIERHTFYGCTKLADIDLSNIIYIGTSAFCSTKLPETSTLEKVEFIGATAFYGCDNIKTINAPALIELDKNALNNCSKLTTLNAPNLAVVGVQAFYNCKEFNTLNAPKIEKLGNNAFTNTAIEELEITETLTEFGSGVFAGCENFKSLYAMVDGEKVTTVDFGAIKLVDGVLYNKVSNGGYVLVCYPQGKTETVLEVIEDTIRIEYGAAANNKSLEKVVLPGSLLYIGDYAFDGCENLKTVQFNSYYAPVLEGSWSGDYTVSITPENEADFSKFEKLYGYNFYYYTQDKITNFSDLYFYSNFKDQIGTNKADGLVCIIPENSSGYDSYLYSTYFTVSEEENSGKVMGAYAIAFINAVKKIPEVATRFDGAIVSAAIDAYNALVDRKDELAFVDNTLIEKFNTARSEYYVDVAEGKIAKLYGMYNNEYCFNLVKDARASYLALTAEEQGRVANGAILEEKITALTTAMGVTPDFSKNYADHFATDTPSQDNPDDGSSDSKDGNSTLALILIIVGAVIVLAGAGVVAIIFVKKNKVAKAAPKTEQPIEAVEKTTDSIEASEITEKVIDESKSTEVEDK